MEPILNDSSLLSLLEQCRQGDEQAFQALFERYQNLVYRLALLTCGDEAAAEDVLQEVFLRLLRSLSTFDPQRSAFTTWLYRITLNQCFQMQRRQRRWWALSEDLPLAARSSSPANETNDRLDLEQALRRLSPKLRSVLVLRYFLDLSYEEIGQVLQIPLGTVKSRLNQALHFLRHWLEESPAAESNAFAERKVS